MNKLVVFVVVFRKRSASGAAAQLGVKQPAISNTLNGLRKLFADELFVRKGKGLVPTSRAEAIYSTLAPAVEVVGELIAVYASIAREAGASGEP